MKWFISTGLLLSLLALTVWADTTTPAVSDAVLGAQSAQTSAQLVSTNSGTPQAVQSNLVTPMVSGGTLTSPDGLTSFTANALQSSGTPVMQVTVIPNPATGDLWYILVQQDLLGTGTLNAAVKFPDPATSAGQMIPAVCANGFIQCPTGTFTNCSFRNWSSMSGSGAMAVTVAGAGSTTDTVGNIGALSGCYCFSKVCSQNNNAVVDIDGIGANVGGGVLAAFMAAKTGTVVTSAQSSGTGVITYYGVKASAVPNGYSPPVAMTAAQLADMPVDSTLDVSQVQSYYNSPALLSTAAAAAKQQQTTTPNSIFNSVSAVALQTSVNVVSCTNLMTPTINIVQRTATRGGGLDGSHSLCADNNVYVVLTESSPSSFAIGVFGADVTGTANGNNCGGPPALDPGLNYNAIPVDTFNFVQPSTTYGYNITSVAGYMEVIGGGCDTGNGTALWNTAIGQGNPVVTQVGFRLCGAPHEQQPSYNWLFTVAYDSQELSTIDNEGCQQYEAPGSGCTLTQDLWDGRPVVMNGLSMGFSQIGQECQDISVPGGIRSVHVCAPSNRPWFRQDRTFSCPNTASPFDFTAIAPKLLAIQNSTSMPTNSTMQYTDPSGTDPGTYTYGVPTDGALPACTQVCKTKVPVAQTVVLPTPAAATATLTPAGVTAQSFSTFYKSCNGMSDGTWVCPVNATNGETVVIQCGCSSDMSDVLANINAAEGVAGDSICAPN